MSKFFNISEVSKILDLIDPKSKKPLNYILRYWEKEFKEIKNGAKLTVEVTVELKDNEKPACVAEQVFLIYE